MSSDYLHLNKRQRRLEPAGYNNISTGSLWGSANQHGTPSNHNQDIITPNLPAFRGPSEAAASDRCGGSDQIQEPGNDWSDSGHASFNSGSQHSFWQGPNACISSMSDSVWGTSPPNAQFTQYGEPTTTNFLESMTLNIHSPQESSHGPTQLSQTLGWGASGISHTQASPSFNQIPHQDNYNFSQLDYRLQATHVLPSFESQPPIFPTLLGLTYPYLDSSGHNSQALSATFPGSFPGNPTSQLPLSQGDLTESGLLSADASDIEVEEETEETLPCKVAEEPCDPESELICFGMVSR